jgi:hypothetical protein
MNPKIKTLGIVAAAALLVAPTTWAQTEKQIQIANQLVPQMVQKGVLRLEVDNRKAWVDPLVWATIDAQAKETLTNVIAIYCSEKYPTVDLFDKQSGKKLASYGPFQGFKIE